MNGKEKGEKAQRIVIGELAKLDINVAIPLTDNLPWDFIAVYNGLHRIQVKSSEESRKINATEFSLRSTNWHKRTQKTYSAKDCDAIICYDFKDGSLYLLGVEDFSGRNSFTIRKSTSKGKGNQIKNANMHDDFLLTKERLETIFGPLREIDVVVT